MISVDDEDDGVVSNEKEVRHDYSPTSGIRQEEVQANDTVAGIRRNNYPHNKRWRMGGER